MHKCCFGICILFYILTQESIGEEVALSAQELETVKARLIDWSLSLHSFTGSYRIEQYEPQSQKTEPFIINIDYRFQDNNILITHEFYRKGKLTSHTDVRYNGVVNNIHTTNGEYAVGALGLESSSFVFPEGSLVSPEMLFGTLRNCPPLKEFLNTGVSTLLLRDNKKILRQVTERSILEIEIGDNNLISRYDLYHWSNRVKEISERWSGDPYDVRKPNKSLELGYYSDINGVQFPTVAQLTLWTWNDQQLEEYKKNREAKHWDPLDFEIRVSTEVDPAPDLVQKFTLDLASAQVNPVLSEKDFSIDYPKDTIYSGDDKSKAKQGFIRQYAWDISTGLGIFAVLIALGVGVWRWKRR